MQLEGSCHCGKVKFTLESQEPWPYMRCYCSICRKTSGGAGYCINLGGRSDTLRVQGREHTKVYRALLDRGGTPQRSEHERHFCAHCGSHLWAFNTRWPELVHPVASAIDTAIPAPPANVHIMLTYKAPWVTVEGQPGDQRFDEYPDTSLHDWHRQHGFDDH